jgi:hypothetical protein
MAANMTMNNDKTKMTRMSDLLKRRCVIPWRGESSRKQTISGVRQRGWVGRAMIQVAKKTIVR